MKIMCSLMFKNILHVISCILYIGILLILNVLFKVWTDEFLTWNPSEFNGTEEMFLPADSVWLPDITLYEK